LSGLKALCGSRVPTRAEVMSVVLAEVIGCPLDYGFKVADRFGLPDIPQPASLAEAVEIVTIIVGWKENILAAVATQLGDSDGRSPSGPGPAAR
jgi:hypothetical protein